MKLILSKIKSGKVLLILTLLSFLIVWMLAGNGQAVNSSKTETEMDMKKGSGMKMESGKNKVTVMIDPNRQQFIGVKTGKVQERRLTKTIQTVGRFSYNESKFIEINTKIEGWVKDLIADFEGKQVRKGEPLFTFYSPKLITAQQEYLFTKKRTKHGGKKKNVSSSKIYGSARTRMLLWDITEEQIDEIEKKGEPVLYPSMLSPIDGYVIEKSIMEGGYFKPGTTLFKIADLSDIWLLAEIYEYEIPLIKLGQKITFKCTSHPGQIFSGTISYIHPFLNKKTRSVQVRVVIPNPDLKYQPDMFANVSIQIDAGNAVAVPSSAVLDSGNRKTVFLKRGKGMFEPREVKLGQKIGSYYPVLEGLAMGDEVVTSANFLIDSESQLMASMEGMMGLTGMGDWKMEGSKMDMVGMDMEEGSGTEDEMEGSGTMEDMESKGDMKESEMKSMEDQKSKSAGQKGNGSEEEGSGTENGDNQREVTPRRCGND